MRKEEAGAKQPGVWAQQRDRHVASMRSFTTLPRGQCRPVHEGLYKTEALSAEEQEARARRYCSRWENDMSALRLRSDPWRRRNHAPPESPRRSASLPSPPRRKSNAYIPHPRVWNPASLIPPLVRHPPRHSCPFADLRPLGLLLLLLLLGLGLGLRLWVG